MRRSWPAPRMEMLCGVSGRPLMPQLSVGCEAETKEDTARLAPARPSSGVSMATSEIDREARES